MHIFILKAEKEAALLPNRSLYLHCSEYLPSPMAAACIFLATFVLNNVSFDFFSRAFILIVFFVVTGGITV